MFGRKKASISWFSLEGQDGRKNCDQSSSQLNGHINPTFNSLGLNDLRPNNDEAVFRVTKTAKVFSKAIQTETECILFQRKSASPKLQTVVEWQNLEVEITAKGETKKILNNISGRTSNLKILAVLGEWACETPAFCRFREFNIYRSTCHEKQDRLAQESRRC